MSKISQGDFTFEGFEQANTTPVPDVFFDELLSQLSGAELKVLLYIIRRTWGFKKATDAISLSQLQNGIVTKDGKVLDRGCGIKRRDTIVDALASLEKKGCIIIYKAKTSKRDNATTIYGIRFKNNRVVTKPDYPPSHQTGLPLVTKPDYGSHQTGLPVVTKPDPQETVIQQTDLQQTGESSEPNQQKPTRSRRQKSSSLSSQSSSQKSFSFEVPPEAKIILDYWDEIQGYEGPRTEKEIKTAKEMARLKLAKEDVTSIKDFILANNGEWYKQQGLDIHAILTYYAKWKSAQSLKNSKASAAHSQSQDQPCASVLVTDAINERNKARQRERKRARELAASQAMEV